MLSLLLSGLVLAAPVPENAAEKKVLASLQGEWIVGIAEFAGEELAAMKDVKFTIKDSTITSVVKGENRTLTLKLDVTKTPMEMDKLKDDKLEARAIFELNGDVLKICIGGTTTTSTFGGGKTTTETTVDDRPTAFDSKKNLLMTLKRVSK